MSLIRRREANVTTRRAGVLRKSVAQLAVLGLMATGAFAVFAVPTAGAQEGNYDHCHEDLRAEGSGGVRICKTGPETAVAGTDITYTLDIDAWGHWDKDFSVYDDLTGYGAPLSLVSVTPSSNVWNCSYSTDVVDCRAPDTDPDQVDNTTITVVAHIDSAFMPTLDNNPIENCATIERHHNYDDNQVSETDYNYSDTSCFWTDVTRASDLSIQKDLLSPGVGQVLIVPGTVQYAITVTNNGPSDSDQIAITDKAPGYGSFDLVPLGNQGWDCSGSIASFLSCTHDPLVAGDSATLDVTLNVASTSQAGLTLDNCSFVTKGDPSGATNSSDESPNGSCATISGGLIQVEAAGASVTPAPTPVVAVARFTG